MPKNFLPSPAAVVYIGNHIDYCKGVEYVKDGEAPFAWNVLHPITIDCDKDGQEVSNNYMQPTYVYLEFNCSDVKCPAKKRVSARFLGEVK